jgi:hypothetical protein
MTFHRALFGAMFFCGSPCAIVRHGQWFTLFHATKKAAYLVAVQRKKVSKGPKRSLRMIWHRSYV